MTVEFQEELVRFLLQSKEGKKYIKHLDAELFDLPEHQLVYGLLQGYIEKYNVSPSSVNLLEYWDRAVKKKKTQITKDVYDQVAKTIKTLYKVEYGDTAQLRESLIEYAQRKQTKLLFKDNADKVKGGDGDFFQDLYKKMGRIIQTATDLQEENTHGGFLLHDNGTMIDEVPEGSPTFLRGINNMTSAGGFYSPQLVIFMGGPKSFKTGTLINLAIEYMRDGKKVYYADCENGISSIRARVKQSMLRCQRSELKGLKKVYNEMVTRYKVLGGDMVIDFYPAYTRTVADVEANLEYLRDEHGWIPDLICWDYPDLFLPIDKSQKEKRFQIQHVYFDIIRLNNRWNFFSIGLSQVNKAAVDKAVINMKDFAEDFGKAMNAHAAFALCRTTDEQELGIGRYVPVVQREGVSFRGVNTCAVKIDEAVQGIDEMDLSEATRMVESKIAGKEVRTVKTICKKSLNDE